MLDRERADFFAALDSLKAAFGPHVVATEIPIGAEHEVRGVDRPDRHEGLRLRGRRGAAAPTEVEIPEELRAQAEEYREKLMDEVAENSDELMERYLDGEEIDHEEIVTALKRGVTEGQIFPVTCGVGDPQPRAPTACSRRWSRTCPRRRCAAPCAALGDEGEEVEIAPEDGRAAGRLRLQDPRRPLRGADQPLPRLPRHAPLRLAGAQRRPPPEGADRPARPACSARTCSRSPSSAPATSARSPS